MLQLKKLKFITLQDNDINTFEALARHPSIRGASIASESKFNENTLQELTSRPNKFHTIHLQKMQFDKPLHFEYSKNLNFLWLNELIIDSIEFEEEPVNLKNVVITDSTIHTLDFLRESKSLEALNLHNVAVTEYSVIPVIATLKEVSLTKTTLDKIAFEEPNYTTETLDISQTSSSGIGFLQMFPRLKYLNISGTNVSDLTPLVFTDCQRLDVSRMNLEDLHFISYVPDLKYLSIVGNKIKDLTPLLKLKYIDSLTIEAAGNPISTRECMLQLEDAPQKLKSICSQLTS